MANYKFTGLSFYIDINENTGASFDAVRALIEPFYNDSGAFKPYERNIEYVEDLIGDYVDDRYVYKDEYSPQMHVILKNLISRIDKELCNSGMLYAEVGFPGDTPKDKRRAMSEIREDKLYIYIPLSRKRNVDVLRNYVLEVITSIFGEQVYQIAELNSGEEYNYFDIKPQLIYKRK